MKTIFNVIIIILLALQTMANNSYSKQWQKVDSLQNLGQLLSALDVVMTIYSQSKTDGHPDQTIRALLYKIRLEADFQENSYEKAIDFAQNELEDAETPVKQVLYSILAQVHWSLYQNNSWQINQRTPVVGNLSPDINTWDTRRFVAVCTNYYLLSVSEADALKNIPLGQFESILEEKKSTRNLRPTLFDFLVFRAIEFFSDERASVTIPSNVFRMDEEKFFTPVDEFVGIEILTEDTLSFEYQALELYQQVLQFHLTNKKDIMPLVDADLARLQFVHRKIILPAKDEVYIEALRKMYLKYGDQPISAEIAYHLATMLRTQGSKYKPLVSDDYKWKLKEALEITESAAKRFPDTDGAKNCSVLVDQIKSSQLNITANHAVTPRLPSLALVGYRNIDSLYLRIVSLDYEADQKRQHQNQKDQIEKYLSLKAYTNWSLKLPNDNDYQTHSTEIKLPPLPSGYYILLASSTPDFNLQSEVTFLPFWSTNLSVIGRLTNDGYEFHILDRKNGQPLPNLKIQLISQTYDYRIGGTRDSNVQQLVTDKNGFGKIPRGLTPDNSQIYLKISTSKDNFVTETIWMGYPYETEAKKEIRTYFFTDRAIYRPGQTMYYKGIVLEKDGDKSTIKTKFPSTVSFTDVNGQEIGKQDLVTNEFGSFSGSFVVPQGVLAGYMQISDNYGSVGFQVEEYKRPRFEVTFPPIEGSYKLGEEIQVTGKAMSYAGSTLSDAIVSYRVVRNARFPIIWWGWRDRFPSSPEMEIASGNSITDSIGQFRITFKAIADPEVSKELSPIFTYTVYVDVTDINGETQRAETSVSVGYAAMVITTNVEDHVNADEGLKLEIKTTNLNGQPEAATGSISINRIIHPKQVLFSRKWARPDKFTMSKEEFTRYFPGEGYDNEDDIAQWEKGETIFSEIFATPDSSAFPVLKNIAPGLYLIEITSTDSFGEAVNYTKYFRVYSPSGKKTAETAPLSATLLTPEAEPGQTASILVASPLKNAFLVVDILSKNTNTIRRYYRLNNSQLRIDIPVFEENRGNIAVNFVLVSNNRVFQESMIITVPYTNKKLDIEISSFRSNLEPGQEEEWQITIKDKQGDKVVAELLAGMYDASLDAFVSQQWPFSIYDNMLWVPAWRGDNGFSVVGGRNHWYRRDWGSIIEKEYERLIWIGGYDLGWGGLRRMSMVSESKDIMIRGVAEGLQMSSDAMDMPPPPPPPGMGENISVDDGIWGEDLFVGQQPVLPLPVKPRTDFNETAFFFPHLVTNEQGETALKFRIPESLTRWNLMGLAHTKDLKTGIIAKSLVTRKDLMVFPNAPRFLREGDTMQFSAKISNVSEEQLEGQATLRFFDAFTMQPIDESMGLINPDKAFTVDKGQSAQVVWEIKIPEGLQAIVYRITATDGNFSDGEEAPLPVLTNRMLVTESLPLPVRANTSRTFTFDKLLNSGQAGSTLKNHNLTLEFTSNPAWYAVQALPYLMEYPYDCSEQVFSRFYANSLASHIANSDPKIRRVFELWRTITPDALKSNLEKNEQLKSVLLEESPWVREAKSESERKQRIALLFDLNRMALEKQNALRKLQELQTINGGWPWFTGMPESVYITRHIVTGLGRMIRMGALSPEVDNGSIEILRKAISFLDREMLKSYEKLKKDNPEYKNNNHLGYSDIQYFYARTYFLDKHPFDSSLTELVEYYKAQAVQYWNKNNQYMKAMTALFLNRMGEKSTAALIMRSLSETALRSDEMGMYWRNQPRGWFWYEAPVETHSLIIEAYDEVLNDTKTVDELKVWLLKQKQVQDWKTTRATTEAVYALLMRGSSLLASDEHVTIHVGGALVKQEVGDGAKPEPGTGYFRKTWNAGEILPHMGKIEVSNPNPTVAWGAMYWQYFEQLDKITPAQSPLKLEKELFVEVNSPSGPVLQPITSDKPIKVGDRVVVRVILTTDRDMEYIHLKDMRASAFEPVNVLSGYRWQGGLGYYESIRDAATNFFIDYLPKGTYVFEYKLSATQKGEFSNGITTVQCMYAPEFSAHSEGIRIKVE